MTPKLTTRIIQRVKAKLRLAENSRYQFFDVGFHGDKYLQQLVNTLIRRANCFIETGANVGSTLAYVARTYPQITCISCEPDEEAFRLAAGHIKDLPNVTIYHATSQEFIRQLSSNTEQFFEQTVLFWLDAHGYGFEWPLKEELAYITMAFKRGYILVDDFKVPGQQQFAYHQYNGQVCSFDYVQKALNPNMEYHLFYPDYNKRTSQHHPLVGWGLFAFGDSVRFDNSEMKQLKIKHG